MKALLSTLLLLFLFALLPIRVLGSPPTTGSTITVDGDPSDWVGTAPTIPNSWTISEGEFIWVDEVDDDTGNGSWIYPTTFQGTEADLVEVRITWNENYLYILLKFADLPDGQWNRTAISIGIDQDLTSSSGAGWFPGWTGVAIDERAWWEYGISIVSGNIPGAGIAIYNQTWQTVANTTYPAETPLLVANDTDTDCIELGIPLSVIGDPSGKTWRFSIMVGLQRGGIFAAIGENATADAPGGGLDDEWVDPCAFDLAFAPSKAEQEANLGEFDPETDTPVKVKFFMDIYMYSVMMPSVIEDLKSRILDLEGQVSDLQDQISSLQDQVSTLQGDLNAAKSAQTTYLAGGIVVGLLIGFIIGFPVGRRK